MKRTIWMASVTMLLMTTCLPLYAQSFEKAVEKDSACISRDSLEKMTNEELRAYCDSIYWLRYPKLQVIYRQDTSKLTVPPDRQQNTFSYSNNYVPNSVTVNTSKAVGQIEIQSGISPTGARTYTVPIKGYQLEGVFCPDISLSYNSQGGNCGYGKGWSIGGLQSITRANKSIYYDGKTDGIKLNTNDAFCLNGVRLVRTSSSDYLYETEQGNIKVSAIVDGSVVKYFNVYYPNGYTAVFGMTSTSDNKLEYPITSLTDMRGRSITFNYATYNSNYYISNVYYDNGNAHISFTYNLGRPDYKLGYRAGLMLDSKYLLESVSCTRNNTDLGVYTFTYSTDNHIPLLNQIDFSANGSSLNPLKFYYGDNSAIQGYYQDHVMLNQGYQFTYRKQMVATRGRFDYFTDNEGILFYPNGNPYYYVYNGSNNYFVNNYNTNYSCIIYNELSDNSLNFSYNLSLGTGFVTMMTADLDGDLHESIIQVNNYVSSNSDVLTFKTYKKTSTGFVLQHTRTYYYPLHTDGNGNKSVRPKLFYTGDFNGDGRMEVMVMTTDNPFGETGNTSTCYIYDLKNNTTLYSGHVLNFDKTFESVNMNSINAEILSDKVIPLDYDGDGKTDLCHINANSTDVYTFTQNGSSLTVQQVAVNTNVKRDYFYKSYYSVGDFNGDGLMDIVASNRTDWLGSSLWKFYISKGNGQFEYLASSYGPNTENTTSDFLVQDIDGDGITDIVEVQDNSFTGYMVKNNQISTGATQSIPHTQGYLAPVNINSSTLSKQFVCLYDTAATLYSYKTNLRQDQALTGMANSNGVVEKNYYYTINDYYGIFIKYGDAIFPYCNIFEAITVLAGNEIFKGGSSIDINKNFYYNAVVHRQGLGFRGFQKVTFRNKRNQSTITTYEPYKYSLLKEVDGPTSRVTYINDTIVDSYKRLKALVTSRTDYDKLKSITGTTEYTYDQYGQVLTENTSLPGSITVNKAYIYTNFSDINTKYHLGRLATATSTTSRGSSQHSEETSITSYNTCDQPLTIINKVNNNKVKTTTMVYDSYGNMTSKSIKPYSSTTPRTFTYQYTSGNRMIMETPPVGLWRSYSYNTDGTVSSTGSPVGTTSFTYDAFGRVTSESRPDTTVINKTYSWNSANGGLYAITTSGTNIPTTVTIYDALNREVRSTETRFDNSILKVDKVYDTYGDLTKESYPYKSGSPTYKQYSYDPYHRLEDSYEAGKTISYSYSETSTTVSDGTMSTTSTTDALGGVTSVEDQAGTIYYTLNGAGNPTTICAPGGTNGITTTIGYDGYERRTSIADPSHGTTTYTYHSTEGYLKSETNAKNQTTNYVCDNYGRLTQKTSPEFYTDYTYNNTLNKITAETSSNGTSTTYSYDALGRLSSTRENAVDSKWLQRDYTYSNGKVSSIKYTSQSGILTTEIYTYTNGYMTNMSLVDHTPIFSLTSEDNNGHTSSIANLGLTRNYGYTVSGLPTSRNMVTGSIIFQDQTYNFNAATGNLTSRYNGVTGLTENFTYDNLHRLTNYEGTTVTYDNNGNIASKGDIGSFAYNTTGKPYAVSDVTLNNSFSVGTQNVSYYSFDRPSMITNNGYTATFTYNGNYDRVKMEKLYNSQASLTRYYLGGCYELDVKPSGNTEKLYLMGGYYDAPVAFVKKNGSTSCYRICRDYLGSITLAMGEQLSYDAWGRLRNTSNNTLYIPENEPELGLGRGFCGHEHLTGLGLINMNARLYDPMLGRFLSPDPYVQAPDHSQSFNRYSYCLNNPLKYKDENGKFILSLISGLIKGTTELISGKGYWYSPFYRAYKNTINDIKTDWGLFKGNFSQIITRFTWELPQTTIGSLYTKWNLIFHDVDKIRYYDGATYIIDETGKTSGTTGSTLGSFINITTNEPIPEKNGEFAPYLHSVYAHEYGHYLQSQSSGWAYLFKYGIPSVIDFHKNKGKTANYLDRNGNVKIIGKHSIHDAEIDANKRAAQYFSKKGVLYYNDYDGWNYESKNPTYSSPL